MRATAARSSALKGVNKDLKYSQGEDRNDGGLALRHIQNQLQIAVKIEDLISFGLTTKS